MSAQPWNRSVSGRDRSVPSWEWLIPQQDGAFPLERGWTVSILDETSTLPRDSLNSPQTSLGEAAAWSPGR